MGENPVMKCSHYPSSIQEEVSVYSVRKPFLFLIYLFFFLMLVLPTSFQFQRGIFLAIIVFCGLVAVVYSPKIWRCYKEIVFLWLLTTAAGLFFILEGLINNAPGALRVATVYILWPAVYMLFTGLAHDLGIIRNILKVLIAGIAISCLFNFTLLVGTLAGYCEQITRLLSFQGTGIVFFDGYIEFTSYNLTTAIYGLTFLIALYLCQRKSGITITKQRYLLLLIILDLLICLVSGRRAFWLIALLSPAIIYAFCLPCGIRVPKRYVTSVGVVTVLLCCTAGIWFDIKLDSIWNQLRLAFDFQGEASANVRYVQFLDLLGGWMNNPLAGSGHGASTWNVIRSDKMPWAYELSYMALLFHTGIIGMLIYSFAVGWIFIAGIKAVRYRQDTAPIFIPLLCGLFGFLIINATNPYLGKFDYLWTIFLPVAAINAFKTSHAS